MKYFALNYKNLNYLIFRSSTYFELNFNKNA